MSGPGLHHTGRKGRKVPDQARNYRELVWFQLGKPPSSANNDTSWLDFVTSMTCGGDKKSRRPPLVQ
ncbi:hypothetical protein PG993_002530 [Apiospora rasikravindrae]|uniref:Uncharacterized protein n=1 Tax=Apiospora rasikravindrae TaxID=990691 RepID=A0ABR1TWX0_9PEZI